MSISDMINPRQIARNWKTVRNSPYASLKFQYELTRVFVVIISLFIIYQIVNMILKYDSGSNLTTLVMRVILVIVGVVLVIKFYGTLAPIKKSLQQYNINPAAKDSQYKGLDVGKEVDDILASIEKNKQNQTRN